MTQRIPDDDPNDPSMVIEVLPPGGEVWVAQLLNVRQQDGAADEKRVALCKCSAGERVVSQFEQVYGAGRVRLVPHKGYEPDPRAEEVRQALQSQTIPVWGGTSDVSKLQALTLVGGAFTMFLTRDDGSPLALNIMLNPDGRVVVSPLDEHGVVRDEVELWGDDMESPLVGQLRMAWNLMMQWLVGRFPEINVKLSQIVAATSSPNEPAPGEKIH
jgi:hypothetical protein